MISFFPPLLEGLSLEDTFEMLLRGAKKAPGASGPRQHKHSWPRQEAVTCYNHPLVARFCWGTFGSTVRG